MTQGSTAGQRDQVATAKGSVTGFAASNVQAYASASSNSRLNKVVGSAFDRQYFNNDDIARGLLGETSTVPMSGAQLQPLPPDTDPTLDPTASRVASALQTAETLDRRLERLRQRRQPHRQHRHRSRLCAI